MLTAEIITLTSGTPLHLYTASELTTQWVSSRSRWRDVRWLFDNPTPGIHPSHSAMVWNVLLPDHTLLTDPQHSRLLDWLRRFVWSLFAAPGNGVPLAPGSLS